MPVERAAMVHWWDSLTFLHWRYPASVIQRVLPPGLEVETFEGSAWVGLVPFYLRVGAPHVPSVPWVSRFCETNVRTYVRSGDGERGARTLCAKPFGEREPGYMTGWRAQNGFTHT